MKKIINLLVAIILVNICFIQCSKDNDEEQNQAPGNFAITVTPTANTAALTWTSAEDPDGDDVTYAVQLNTELLASNLTVTQYNLSNLEAETDYTGKVVAKDSNGATTEKSFSFTTTATPNNSPDAPTLVLPANNASNINLSSLELQWQASTDPDGDSITYDVYFDTNTNPTTNIASDLTTASHTIASDLEYETTYYWKVVAKDGKGGEAESTISSFETKKDQAVSTVAGSTAGFNNGTSTNAKFNRPVGIARDTNGNLFIADNNNHIIRKITPNGVVTTLAGSVGNSGSADGTGTSAKFNSPTDIVIDALGNLFVSDFQNHKIRKITPNGVVTTFAGSGAAGNTNGQGTAAQFNRPYGLALDGSTLYVAETGNHKIRRVTAGGTVSNYAGSIQGNLNGTLTSARFNSPTSLAIHNNILYVVESFGNRIRKIENNQVTNFVGSSDGAPGNVDGTGTDARFKAPEGITVDANGNLFITERGNHQIRKITPAGVVTKITGTGSSGYQDGNLDEALFNSPMDLTMGENGVFYVSDFLNHKIRKIKLQ